MYEEATKNIKKKCPYNVTLSNQRKHQRQVLLHYVLQLRVHFSLLFFKGKQRT